MNEQILLAIFGFFLGILATLITQILSRRFGFDSANRKLILDRIDRIREMLADYEQLFKCDYPDLYEFVFANDELNSKDPYYSDENPQKVYNAFTQYQSIRKVISDKERLTDEALNLLETKRVIRREKINRRVFPERYPNIYYKALGANGKSIFGKLQIMHLCEYIIFEDFPNKVTTSIEWDRLKTINPQDVRDMIHLRLHSRYSDKGEYLRDIESDQLEQVDALSERRENLVRYRNKAFELIREIGLELSIIEQKYIIPV
jgi:hypothetical protein